MPRNAAGCRVGCCGVLMVKAEAGALSGVTDAGLRLPVHRCKGPDDRAGQCKGKCRYGPCSEDIPPPVPLLSFPGQGLQPHSFTPLSDYNRQKFDCSSLCHEISPHPHPYPRVLKVSILAQITPPPHCVSIVYHFIRPPFTAPPPASPATRPFCPENESRSR